MRFSDRIDPATFTDDEVVGVAIAERDLPNSGVPEEHWVFIPERLFERLLSLGRAYSLHFASIVEEQAESQLNAAQCESFLEELQFLSKVVSDPALATVLKELIPKARKAASHLGMSLRFNPP